MRYNNNDIVDRIKEIMSEKFLNQTSLGRELGFSQSNISQILRKERGAMPLIEKISQNYNVSREWLLTGLGSKYMDYEEKSKSSDLSELTNQERLSLVRELNELQKRHQDLMKEAGGIMDRVIKINERLLFGGKIS